MTLVVLICQFPQQLGWKGGTPEGWPTSSVQRSLTTRLPVSSLTDICEDIAKPSFSEHLLVKPHLLTQTHLCQKLSLEGLARGKSSAGLHSGRGGKGGSRGAGMFWMRLSGPSCVSLRTGEEP